MLAERYARLCGARDALQMQEREISDSLDQLAIDEGHWLSAVVLIEGLADGARQTVCDSVTALASSAMQDVFGESAGCSLEFEESGDRGARHPVFTAWDQAGVKADPLRGMGGSAAQVIGTALRLFFLAKTKSAPFLILDEPLDGLDDHNVTPVAQWLRAVCDELGLQLVVISHLGRDVFEGVADQVLHVVRDGNESHVE